MTGACSVQGGRGVPGVVGEGWYRVGTGRVLYRVLTTGPRMTIFSHILALGPYLRPNEGYSRYFHEVSEIGSRIDSELTQNRPRINPESTLPDPPQTGPQMPSDASFSDLRYLMVRIRVFLRFY